MFLPFPGGMPVPDDRVPVPRPGPPRHQQLLPDQVELQPGPALLHLHHGAPPLRPVPHDPQLQGQPDTRQSLTGNKQDRNHGLRVCVFQFTWPTSVYLGKVMLLIKKMG